MEVHAHSHTERKKWTHYLWEFLMLFPCCVLWFFGRESTGAYGRASAGKEIYKFIDNGSEGRYSTYKICNFVLYYKVQWNGHIGPTVK